MTGIPVTVQVGGEEDFARLARAFREASTSGLMRRRARERIRQAARPAVIDARIAARAVEVSSSRDGHVRPDRSTRLRARIARATDSAATVRGVRISVNPRQVGDYGVTLPRYLDAELPRYVRWRHPVFGRSPWEEQRGQPWFFVTMRRHESGFTRGVQRAIDDVINEIERDA